MKKNLFQITIHGVLIIFVFCLGYLCKDNPTIFDSTHPIDIENKKCIEKSNAIDYPICAQKAERAWDKEIQKNLNNLKNTMTKEDFKYIQSMNSDWNKLIQSEINAINRFIYEKDGIIYQTLGSSQTAELKKQYAILLYSIYDNYNEKITK